VAPTERHKFQHQGRTIYSWNQTLQELNLFVEGPPGVRAKQLAVAITSTHLSIGIAGNPPYLSVSICASVSVSVSANAPIGPAPTVTLLCVPQHDLAGRVKPSESFWTLGTLFTCQMCCARSVIHHLGLLRD